MKERDEGYDSIRAIATVFIVLFHFLLCALEAKGFQATPRFISPLVDGYCNIGRLGVAWFSILSGCVLWKTYREGIDLKVFYRRRVLRLFIPLWISYAFFLASQVVSPTIISTIRKNGQVRSKRAPREAFTSGQVFFGRYFSPPGTQNWEPPHRPENRAPAEGA